MGLASVFQTINKAESFANSSLYCVAFYVNAKSDPFYKFHSTFEVLDLLQDLL